MLIKLLHWNIWFKEKIENIVELLKEYKPDIVCLNELSKGLYQILLNTQLSS